MSRTEAAAGERAGPAPPPASAARTAGRSAALGTAGRRAARRAGHAGATYLGVGGMLLLLVVFLTITQEQFATSQNFINILNTNAVLLVVSVGLTFVLLVGGFDLSLGGMLALAGVGLALLIEAGVPPLPAVLAVVAAGTLVGLVLNGWLIAGVGLSFLVVTLATSSLFASAALVITGGQSQSVFEQGLLSLGTGTWAGVPYSVWIALAVLVVAVVVLRWTGYGRMVYAVGGNPEAARLAGIDVTLVRASAYGIAGGLAALAGVLTTAQLTAASPTAGAGVALTAGAAVLLGGTTFTGGRGTMLGTLLGVLFLGVLSNGITLTGVSAFWQGIVSGIVLILALLLDRVRTRREAAG